MILSLIVSPLGMLLSAAMEAEVTAAASAPPARSVQSRSSAGRKRGYEHAHCEQSLCLMWSEFQRGSTLLRKTMAPMGWAGDQRGRTTRGAQRRRRRTGSSRGEQWGGARRDCVACGAARVSTRSGAFRSDGVASTSTGRNRATQKKQTRTRPERKHSTQAHDSHGHKRNTHSTMMDSEWLRLRSAQASRG